MISKVLYPVFHLFCMVSIGAIVVQHTNDLFLHIVFFPLSYYLAMIIHELGHIIVAKIDGWTLNKVSFGFFQYDFIQKSFSFPKTVEELLGKSDISMSRQIISDLDKKFIRLSLGGPLANLFFSIIVIALIQVTPQENIQTIFANMVLASLMLYVFSIIPINFLRSESDGYIIYLRIYHQSLFQKYILTKKLDYVMLADAINSAKATFQTSFLPVALKHLHQDLQMLKGTALHLEIKIRRYIAYYYIDTKQYQKTSQLLTQAALLPSHFPLKPDLIQLYVTAELLQGKEPPVIQSYDDSTDIIGQKRNDIITMSRKRDSNLEQKGKEFLENVVWDNYVSSIERNIVKNCL
ncbi:site-2 protease family protein [Paenibacillus faecalis]|uniref:site-2 protease family protein n=1 Tax=Paenibacillus faecalis TaxID=2079532 RepID=UPI000D1133FF|nr:site-2 protease family protein [Paenibacillus faecalis]